MKINKDYIIKESDNYYIYPVKKTITITLPTLEKKQKVYIENRGKGEVIIEMNADYEKQIKILNNKICRSLGVPKFLFKNINKN